MYGHSQPMNIPTQMSAGADDEDVSVGADNHHLSYDTHSLGNGVVVEDAAPDSVYGPSSGSELGNSSQLTLSFRGQVYVFDSVTPDKVQAVLLLLGGCELSSGPPGMEGVADFPGRCNQPQRAASLNRFRQKRKERCFDKKVRYSVRQEVALRMQRNKGQFTSAKKSEGGAFNWGNSQESGQDDSPSETSCSHCGISSKSTPMMRRGPSGPRSLCNACGLFWANRGTLRDLSKKTQDHSLIPIEQGEGEANDSGCGAAIHTDNELVSFSNDEDTALLTEP
ncbi:GATA transcription factor 25 isoform X2 [Mangifera indica]|uniref:GATA transcription factor 25 isoform X2 n=1 Tax=Mangifera indica TaxID=29780 RepID=UPI001CFAE0E5|nr:GATA transcription factor 25 isoform X2 [Mangifera indica]